MGSPLKLKFANHFIIYQKRYQKRYQRRFGLGRLHSELWAWGVKTSLWHFINVIMAGYVYFLLGAIYSIKTSHIVLKWCSQNVAQLLEKASVSSLHDIFVGPFWDDVFFKKIIQRWKVSFSIKIFRLHEQFEAVDHRKTFMVILFEIKNYPYTPIFSLVGVGVGEISDWNFWKL